MTPAAAALYGVWLGLLGFITLLHLIWRRVSKTTDEDHFSSVEASTKELRDKMLERQMSYSDAQTAVRTKMLKRTMTFLPTGDEDADLLFTQTGYKCSTLILAILSLGCG